MGHRSASAFNADTITSTIIAGAVVIVLGLMLRRSASSEVPGKLQLAWEALVTWVNDQVESTLGRLNPFVVPLAASLFVFIFVANLLEVIPTDHKAPPPTADVNLTYPLALLVIICATVYGIRERGVASYAKGFFEPYPVMAPLQHPRGDRQADLAVAATLRQHLRRRRHAVDHRPAAVLADTGARIVPWKLFGMFIGAIQALIFALLTILYFGMAGSGHGGDDHGEAHSSDEDASKQEAEGELQPA